MADAIVLNQRQMLYWRLIAATGGLDDVGAPSNPWPPSSPINWSSPAILDRAIGVDVLLHRYPKLKPHFESIQHHLQPAATEESSLPDAAGSEDEVDPDLRRTLRTAKLLLNVFGPNTRSSSCSAARYNQWCQDVAALERCPGAFSPGSLRSGSATACRGSMEVLEPGQRQRAANR